MPTPQIDDRKEIARIAIARGFRVAETRQHLSPTAPTRSEKALFEVEYIKGDSAAISVTYNSIDKMMSAQLSAGSRVENAQRTVTVLQWLDDYGDPEERVVVGSGRAKLLRDNRTVAEAFINQDGNWTIRLRDNSSVTLVTVGLRENVKRQILIAALKAL